MDFFIIGAGGVAKETHFLFEQLDSDGLNFKAFVDKDPVEDGRLLSDCPVIGEALFLKRHSFNREQVAVVFAIGSPEIVISLLPKFEGFHFPNLIHPSALISKKQVKLGSGNIICANCTFTTAITIGSHNFLNLGVTVSHDCTIGSNNLINAGCHISGGVRIGNGNLLGVGAIILQSLTMGDGSILAAGALLTKDLGNGVLALGVPARVIDSHH